MEYRRQSPSPISQSPEEYFSFYHNPDQSFARATVQNNPSDQTLESVFSRLNVSIQNNEELGYPSSFGGEFLDGSGYGFGRGFSRTGQERNNVMIGEGTRRMGFDGLMTVGPDTESRETTFMFNPYQSYLPDSSSSRSEFSILPSTSVHGAGRLMMPRSSNNKNITSSSFDSHNACNNNNQIDNSSERPHWLHKPLNCLSLGESRGRFVALAKDQFGCRFLQKAIHEASNEKIDMIFMEVIDHVGELMSDPFANYVVQKIVDVCSEEQKDQILLMIKDRYQIVNICLNLYGARAVQKLLEKLTTQQQISSVMSALSPGAVPLTKDINGHRVIQYCLKNLSDEDNKYLLNEVAANCYQIAIDKSGCCAMQQCVDYSKGESRAHLVGKIIENALYLAEDQYGNYVVQHILGLQEPQITESLVRQLEGKYASLSCNRYGSNVVQRCLESGEPWSTRIIMELLRSLFVSRLLVDPFGNYVIQTALSVSKGFAYDALLILVRENYQIIRSHIHGKWVLKAATHVNIQNYRSKNMERCPTKRFALRISHS